MPEKNSRKELKLVLQKENLIGEVLIYIRGVENEDSIICMDKYPYVIVELSNKVDFVQIDKMALKIGMEYDNEKRIRSGIKYALLRVTNLPDRKWRNRGVVAMRHLRSSP